MSAEVGWVTPVLWVGVIVFVVGFLLFVASPNRFRRLGRGGFSVQHLLTLNSVWEPGKKYVFEQKQEQHEDEKDQGAGGPDV